MNQLPVEFPVRLIPHGQIHPGFLVHNALVVGKGIKARFPMVGAHAAFAETAEAHAAGGQVDNGIVDATAAKATFCSNFPRSGFAGSKNIQCQGMLQGVDFGNGFLQGVISHNGHQRAENLLLHHGVPEGYGGQDGWCDPECFFVGIPAQDHFFRFDQSQDPPEMLFVYDFTVIGVKYRAERPIL